MGESLLQARHPALDRLYTIWRLLRADNLSPPASAADANLLDEWQDHLVIVETAIRRYRFPTTCTAF